MKHPPNTKQPNTQSGEGADNPPTRKERTDMTERERRLLEVLKAHTIKNAIEVLADGEYWADRDTDEEGSKARFEEAIERCADGRGTDEDWDMLVDETTM